jgi:ankyrin repeat protein
MKRDFWRLLQAVVKGETSVVSRLLARSPELAVVQLVVGATRQKPSAFFFTDISHYVLAGDTALHMAAAAFQPRIAERLVRKGADCRARNRRGAEPLHYAADTNHWSPVAQRKTIEFLLAAGADPNALDKSGVTPLHRAIRTRSSGAVEALVAGGADVHLQNKRGSTPHQLALQDTGRSGAGSRRARDEQRKIIAFLLEAGASAEACP